MLQKIILQISEATKTAELNVVEVLPVFETLNNNKTMKAIKNE